MGKASKKKSSASKLTKEAGGTSKRRASKGITRKTKR